ncbi:MAG: OmpA family protein [Myxococcota bacterium]|jgi:peptidoglycan-associated lipoprotein|nr:OmpA family protein [Myxococcota bacterium]
MRNLVIFMALAMVLGMGCRKNKGDVTVPVSDGGSLATGSKSGAPAKTEVATGEMRDLLLALQRVHFSLDSESLVAEAKTALDEAAKKLISHPEVALYVDGHTDERGTTEHNMALGERRADTVIDYLVRLGVPKERLSGMSHGEEQPMATGTGDVVLAQNRRVEFRLMKGDIQLVLEEGTLVSDQGKVLSAKDKDAEKAPEKAAEKAPEKAAEKAPAKTPTK